METDRFTFGPIPDLNSYHRPSGTSGTHPEVEDCDLAAIHGAQLLDRPEEDDGLSIVQVSRTIAGSDAPAADHVMEAVQLRSLDRQIRG